MKVKVTGKRIDIKFENKRESARLLRKLGMRNIPDLLERDAVEHCVEPSQGGPTVTDELSADYVPPSVVCGACGAENRGTNGNCWQCEAEL